MFGAAVHKGLFGSGAGEPAGSTIISHEVSGPVVVQPNVAPVCDILVATKFVGGKHAGVKQFTVPIYNELF